MKKLLQFLQDRNIGLLKGQEVMKTIIAVIFVLSMIPLRADAQGISGAQFLEIGIGSRACAMGEAYTAIADDPSAVYWNPAGMSQTKTMDFMFSHNFWLLDMSMQHFSGVMPTKMGNFGLGLFYSSSGVIPQIEDYLITGEYTAYDAAVSFSYAKFLLNSLSLGFNVKYIISQIEKVSASTYAADIGVLYRVERIHGLQLGMTLQNLGPGIRFIDQADPLPLCFRLGAGYCRDDFSIGVAMNDYIDGEMDIGAGAEYVLMNLIALRAGYNTRNSVSGGFGLIFTNLEFGYAIMQFRDIGFSHLISLRIRGM